MKRKHSPLHDKWHRRVEGQIRCCMGEHPQWFNARKDKQKQIIINSLAKRIVGEIVAELELATMQAEVIGDCSASQQGVVMGNRGLSTGADCTLAPEREGAVPCSPAISEAV